MTTNIVIPYERHQYFHDKMQQYKDAQEEENAVPDAVSLDWTNHEKKPKKMTATSLQVRPLLP
jgi:hypothetical protein